MLLQLPWQEGSYHLRSHKQSSLGKLGSDFHVFAWIMEKLHNLLQGFLGLVLTCHILECDSGLLLDISLGAAFPNAHDATAAFVHAAHEEHQKHKQQHRRQKHAEHHCHKFAECIRRLGFENDSGTSRRLVSAVSSSVRLV